MREASNRILAAALMLTLSGCAVGPDAKRPDMALPADWRETTPPGEAIANLPWWDVFRDQELTALIRTAIANNRDLASAAARVEQARAQMVVVRADLFPSFGAEVTLDKKSTDAVVGTLAWELDIWGKLRRATEGARADLLATEYFRDAVLLTLVSDVASTWVQLRAFDERLEIAKSTLEARRQSSGLVRSRFEGGVAPEIDAFQVETLEAEAAAQVAASERAVAQTENALGVLLGQAPGPIARGEGVVGIAGTLEVPAGIPAQILDRRPDVQAAEQILVAETARVGVRIGERLPAFALTSFGGTTSPDVENLFTNGTWSVALNVVAPVFEFGRRKARVEAQRAVMERARFGYEQTVLQALREVDDSLVAIRTFEHERVARAEGVHAARGAVRLSSARYDGGVTTYLEVLDAERTRFAAEFALVDAATGRILSLIGLYKALGGGWQTEPEQAETTAKAD